MGFELLFAFLVLIELGLLPVIIRTGGARAHSLAVGLKFGLEWDAGYLWY